METQMFGEGIPTQWGMGAIFSLLLALWAIFHIVQNERTGPFGKAVWSVLVLFVPFIGFVVWLLFGPKSAKG
jgi:Phospholipase_D-nuclease N-terminal